MNKFNEIAWTPYKYDFDDKLVPLEDDGSISSELLEEKDGIELFFQEPPISKVMNTAFGLFEVDDTLNPFRQFEFWSGATNFDITQSVVEFLDSCPGIETLTIVSRYTFIIGIGKLFNFPSVRLFIESCLCGKHSNEHTLEKIKNADFKMEMKRFIEYMKSEDHKYWCAYVFPNGKLVSMTSNTLEEHQEQIEKYNLAKNISEGLVLSSTNENSQSGGTQQNITRDNTDFG